jgi:hypothetical protein
MGCATRVNSTRCSRSKIDWSRRSSRPPTPCSSIASSRKVSRIGSSTCPRKGAPPLATIGSIAPYRLDWFVEEDASWEQYGQLFPNSYAIEIIMNRRLLQRREQAGDRAELPRPIDHAATFPTREAAEAASVALAARGFAVREPVGRDDGSWLLELVRVDVCAPPRPDEVSFEILQIIEPLDGNYDGWGAIVVKEPPR